MPYFFVAFTLMAPRLVVALVWLFTRWFEGMFSSLLWLLAGFIFLPTTVLWYTAVQHWFGGRWTLGPVVGIIVALAIDLAPVRDLSPVREYRRRRA
jgi:hypothetical protein